MNDKFYEALSSARINLQELNSSYNKDKSIPHNQLSKFEEVTVMKPMIWHPEPKDKKVNQYLDRINREPWLFILAAILVLVSIFTLLVLLGTF
jgi:hypothetical protein